jgi:hypothetical protein
VLAIKWLIELRGTGSDPGSQPSTPADSTATPPAVESANASNTPPVTAQASTQATPNLLLHAGTSEVGTAKASTTLTLASAPNPSNVGQPVTLTATVMPSAATGTVTFSDGLTPLGTAALSGGTATYPATLSVGSHSLSARYNGDTNYAGSLSSATLTQTVNRPCHDRDHLWLRWNEEEKIGPAKIRDRWNTECGLCGGKPIAKGRSGRDVVKAGLRQARIDKQGES